MSHANTKIIWQKKQVQATELDSLASAIAAELKKHDFFCLWLIGDIGAGKTTISSSLLHTLGLPPSIQVTSPTFTYFNEYKIDDKIYAHCDFYRLTGQSLPFSDFLSGLDYDGIIAEWPQNLPISDHSFRPTHQLDIEKSSDLSSRTYIFSQICDSLQNCT